MQKLKNILIITAIIIITMLIVSAIFLVGFFTCKHYLNCEQIQEETLLDGEIPQASDGEASRTIKTFFNSSYPIVFQEIDSTPNFGGSGKFSLTGVSLGDFEVTEDNESAFWNGFEQKYNLGQKFYALALEFKINIKNGGQLPQTIRLIDIDEAKNEDKIPPINRDYLYENHKPMNDFVQGDSTINNARVVFPVSKDKDFFIFTTGGKSDIRFSVKIENDQISVNKMSLAEISTFSKVFYGDVGEKIAIVKIIREKEKISGYFQSSSVNYANIKGTVDERGNFLIEIIDTENKQIGTMTGMLSFSDKIEGKWQEIGSDVEMVFSVAEKQ